MSTESRTSGTLTDPSAGSSVLTTSPLYNADLAPVPAERRTWTRWHIAALWVGMAVCIPTYTIASGLIASGLNWWQALLCVLLGNLIVLIPMTLNAHPGTAYGIPFPVLLRASFGTLGANLPALMRAIVACGWFGIQTWVGGAAIYSTAAIIFGFDPATKIALPVLGLSPGEFSCFLLFWAINVYFIVRGMESIKWLETFSAPFLLLVGGALMLWAYHAAHGFGPIFAQPDTLFAAGKFWPIFGGGLTAMVGFWATLSLNIPDFSRFARSQRDQIVGQALGLPTTMTFYSFIGIVVTSATLVIFGNAIWDPVVVIAKFGSKSLSALALLTLAVATLSTNIAANVVSSANDFSNLAPRRISFKLGGLLTAIIGLVMMPWKLMADPTGYIFTWLIGYSALLGPIAGIMIADYFVVRRKQLDVAALYDPHGAYRFTHGFSLVALLAFLLAVLPSLPGFLVAVGAVAPTSVAPIFLNLYNIAWFVGFALAFAVYLVLRPLARRA
ncbi:NCS1 family nucleobase:cation symporter-1 [Horticoccus luteus]|uniref:NCS1 family nucleobase:cation symporter-1 n=1 Tax=Horticoccus luteus TaxID=2862869 RepID=A0A8F9TSC0_9BACT|nr:NCS1 family nucleobase:cation symporter-1 [Horticoccus luteus]QYM78135.1 NCS1 family nucleobase:cation symporter-1 [Horticoccus luteus]